MFQRILVPLDGSARAERAIPIATRIARFSGGTVILLQVADMIEYSPYLTQVPGFVPGFMPSPVLNKEALRVKNYLVTLAQSSGLPASRMQTEAMIGLPAQTILTYAQLQKVDLIVMCSHGRTGFTRWALGSIAQKVVRRSLTPVLVLREGSPTPHDFYTKHPARALVALDGSPFAEAALVPTAQLITALSVSPIHGELHLMHVVKTPIAQGELGYTFESADLREKAQQEALTYLTSMMQNRGKHIAAEYGVKVTWSIAMAKDVADTLIQEAEFGASTRTFQGYDLMALATHGRGGFQHWTVGSITERVLGATKLPLFVVRPQEQGTSDTSLPMKEEAIAR